MHIQYTHGLVRTAAEQDAELLAPNLRHADRRELAIHTTLPPAPALLSCLKLSCRSYAVAKVTQPEQPLALFGVSQSLRNTFGGLVWLLASPALLDLKYEFLRHSADWVDTLHGGDFPLLYNVADPRNTLHIRWLRWLGFAFLASIPDFGLNDESVIEFARIKAT